MKHFDFISPSDKKGHYHTSTKKREEAGEFAKSAKSKALGKKSAAYHKANASYKKSGTGYGEVMHRATELERMESKKK